MFLEFVEIQITVHFCPRNCITVLDLMLGMVILKFWLVPFILIVFCLPRLESIYVFECTRMRACLCVCNILHKLHYWLELGNAFRVQNSEGTKKNPVKIFVPLQFHRHTIFFLTMLTLLYFLCP